MAIYAYHPYGASEIAISDESQIGSPSVSYTVGSNPTTMSDFMVEHKLQVENAVVQVQLLILIL